MLTAARTSEVIKATWEEIDLDNDLWTIPAERMKISKEHRVPLSSAAQNVLAECRRVRETSSCFPACETTDL